MHSKKQSLDRQFSKLLLTIVVVEASLGGGGRITEIGELTLRMLLFSLCMTYVACRLAIPSAASKLPVEVWLLLFLFLTVFSFGATLGVANGSSFELLINDMSPLIYFPMILFFALTIRSKNDVNHIALIFGGCGVILALTYLIFLGSVFVGFVSFSEAYTILSKSGEFFFRGADDSFVGFFYKGFLFLCIGFLFVLLHPGLRSKWLAILIFAAIVLTFTRGFLLALLLTLVYGVLLSSRKSKYLLLIPLILFISTIATAFLILHTDIRSLVLRPDSDIIRINDITYVWHQITATMLLFGEGLGAQIKGRDVIEITYLQIFYKQGLIGLGFWAILLFFNYWAFRRVPLNVRSSALVFHLAAIFVYLQSATNPFLTNPIGMSMVLISTVVLLRMAKTADSVDNSGNSDPHLLRPL